MSVGAVGGGLNQYLQSLLKQLTANETQSTSAATDPSQTSSDFSVSANDPSSATSGTTTSPTQTLSDEILSLLTQLQQSTQTQGAGAPSSSASISTASASDPLTQLMSAMDSDGDGTVSETEMESYIQNQGGTKDQADGLFTALNQGNTGNLTEATLSKDLQQAQATPPPGGHRHHHHMPSADQVGDDLLGAMDTDGDGSVDQSEFNSFMAGIGGSSADATSDFAALDPNNTGSVTAADFSAAIKAFENASQTANNFGDPSNPLLTLMNGFAADQTTTNVTA
jgi:Ca2+-binding EF-hand superfamily protein